MTPPHPSVLSHVSSEVGTGSHDEGASKQESVIRKAAWQSSQKSHVQSKVRNAITAQLVLLRSRLNRPEQLPCKLSQMSWLGDHLRTDFPFAAETSSPTARQLTHPAGARYHDARTSQHTVLLRGDRPQPGNPAQHRDAQSRHVPTRQGTDALRILRPAALLALD